MIRRSVNIHHNKKSELYKYIEKIKPFFFVVSINNRIYKHSLIVSTSLCFYLSRLSNPFYSVNHFTNCKMNVSPYLKEV